MNNKRSGYFFFYVNVMCTNNICRRGLGLASYLLIMPEATSSHLDVIGFSFFFFSPYFVIDRRRHHPFRKEINLEIHLLVFSADELERTRGIQTKLQLIILTFSQLEKCQFRRTSFFLFFFAGSDASWHSLPISCFNEFLLFLHAVLCGSSSRSIVVADSFSIFG